MSRFLGFRIINALSAAITEFGANVTEMTKDLTRAIDSLNATIAELEAGQTITQEQIDSLTADVDAANAAIQEIDAAAEAISPEEGTNPEPVP